MSGDMPVDGVWYKCPFCGQRISDEEIRKAIARPFIYEGGEIVNCFSVFLRCDNPDCEAHDECGGYDLRLRPYHAYNY